MKGVFLSYSRRDRDFVRELYRRLTRDGVVCFYDLESIRPGEDFVLRLEEGIAKCEFFVPVLSPDFVTSEWAQKERTAFRGTMIPLLRRPCDVPAFLRSIQQIDVLTDAEFEANYPKICKALGGTVRLDPTPPTDRTVLPPVTRLPMSSHMPHPSMGERFVGRVAALWTVHDQLRQGKTSVVQGTGGLGKTQLAVEYVHRFNVHYPGGVFWTDCEQGIQRLIEILDRSLKLDVDGKLTIPDQLASIWAELLRRPAMLLVFDNFPEKGALREWLPSSGDIHVMVTTRRRDPRALTLKFLTAEEGQRLLGRFNPESRALVEDVGGLPLALALLRAHLETRAQITVTDLRRAIRRTGAVALLERFAEAHRDDLPERHEPSVAATFELSWEQAAEDGRSVLQVMSHLAAAPVPLRLIRASLNWEESDPITDRLSEAVTGLWRLSLVERDPDYQPSAHRLILGFVRHLSQPVPYEAEALGALEAEIRRASDDRDTASYQELEAIVPHAEAVLARPDLPNERGIRFATCLRWHHWTLGRFLLAKQYGQAALEYARLDGNGVTIAMTQSNLATVLEDLGELAEARDLLRLALAAHKRCLPPEHPTIAIHQSNLALVLQDLSEPAEARDLLRVALASNESIYPPGHPNIAIGQANLAMVLRDLGELAEARDLLSLALASDQRTFPPGHPDIAKRQSNLASVLYDLDELTEARDLLRLALASDQQTFPPGHPKIATDQDILAAVLWKLGEKHAARLLAKQAYTAALATFGPDHPTIQRRKRRLDSYLPHKDDVDPEVIP